MKIETIHHVSISVTNLNRSSTFYEGVLGLERIERGLELDGKSFELPGRWYRIGDRQIHLVSHEGGDRPTLREGKSVDPYDVHFAIRVRSYREARDTLRMKGFYPEATEDLKRTYEKPSGPAGFPQIYLLDPDRNIIEINAEELDLD
jgi:catechol 2,3-dioxygenase-like lactoylglutathione lyase family enzyme